MKGLHSCKDCIWYDQCGQDEICKDFSPVDDGSFTYYEGILAENAAEYAELLAEMEA